MSIRKKLVLVSMVAALLLASVSTASALMLRVSSDGDTATCGGDLGCLSNTSNVLFSSINGGFIGNFDITPVSGRLLGNAAQPGLDLSALTTSSFGPGTLKVELTAGNFTGGIVPGFAFSLSGTNAQLVSVDFYADAGNVDFGTGILLGTLDGNGDFVTTGSSGFAPGTTYSLTMIATLTHANGTTTSTDAQINAVPEPGTMLLMGSGLVGLGFWRRFKK